MRIIKVLCVVLCLVVTSLQGQATNPHGISIQDRRPSVVQGFRTTSSTQPISPVALTSWHADVSQQGDVTLAFMIVWRGAPGWFMNHGARGGAGSGTNGDIVRGTVREGGIELTYEFNSKTRAVKIQGTEVQLGNDNVILVDEVDGPNAPRVVRTLSVPADVPMGGRSILPVLGRSPDVVSFIRCDLQLPNAQPMEQKMIATMCGQITGASIK